MSVNTKNTLTKEQLLAALEYDEISIDDVTVDEAKRNDAAAFFTIGLKYDSEKKDYFKALSWYRLAENQNNAYAQNNIGVLYDNGTGVSQDRTISLEHYFKAARNKNEIAMGNIGESLQHGSGIVFDKYKALEWYHKSKKKPNEIKILNKEGFHLKEEDKNKTVYQLIRETEDIVRAEGDRRTNMLEEEIQKLKQNNIDLGKQLKDKEQQLKDKDKSINSLNSVIETFRILAASKNNEA